MLSCKINDQRVPLDPHVISNVVKPCIIKSLFYLFTADLVIYNHGNTHYTTFFYSNLHFFGFLRHICVFCKKNTRQNKNRRTDKVLHFSVQSMRVPLWLSSYCSDTGKAYQLRNVTSFRQLHNPTSYLPKVLHV